MTTPLTATLEFPADTGRVFEMLTSESYLDAKGSGALTASHRVSSGPDSVTVVITRTLPSNFPDLVRQFVGETVTVVETQTWSTSETSSGRPGTMDIEISGSPVTMKATTLLTGNSAGSTVTITGQIKVAVPLIGSRVEVHVLEHLAGVIADEQAIGVQWLAATAQ